MNMYDMIKFFPNQLVDQHNTLKDLISIVKKLRSPDGCDWDKEQTHESLIPYFLEESHEVIEAIQSQNYDS